MALVKALTLPPGGLVLLIILGVLLLRRRPAFARACVGIGASLLFVLSLPAVGTSLLMLHQDYPPLDPSALPAGPEAIVVLGADFYLLQPEYGANQASELTFSRLRYGAFLQRATQLPLLVSAGNVALTGEVKGGRIMARALEEELGVPVALAELESSTTWENAVFSAQILAREGVSHVFLVTHAWHMPRAKRAFEHEGLTVTPAPTAFATAPTLGIFGWLPSAKALRSSYFFFHEALGRIAYRLRA